MRRWPGLLLVLLVAACGDEPADPAARTRSLLRDLVDPATREGAEQRRGAVAARRRGAHLEICGLLGA